LVLGEKTIEGLPAIHTVPAVGYAVCSGTRPWWVYTGDTAHNPALWRRINQMDVGMLVIETAFSNSERDLARRSLHLSPDGLVDELDCIDTGKNYPIYITHTKPAQTELIMGEIKGLKQASPLGENIGHEIRWLHAGQEFEL
jgi:ribonuclease BN (tRNA processing enzyme)